MTRLRFITALLGAAALSACSKDAIQSIAGPTAGSNIKFYNFAVNAPGVNFYANETKVTAVSSTSCTPPTDPRCTSTGIESTTGTAFGSLGNAGLYSSLAPGQYTFTGRIAAAADNGLAVSKLSAALGDGKYYSLYQSGFYDPVAKTTDAFILEDVFPTVIDFSKSYVRFVNAISNSNPMTLWAKNTLTGDSLAIGTSIAYKTGSTFLGVPGAVYDLTVRYAGSNTAVIARAGVSFLVNRTYTVSSRGDMTVTSTTAATRPQLDNTTNR
jgi:hypothetical protein